MTASRPDRVESAAEWTLKQAVALADDIVARARASAERIRAAAEADAAVIVDEAWARFEEESARRRAELSDQLLAECAKCRDLIATALAEAESEAAEIRARAEQNAAAVLREVRRPA